MAKKSQIIALEEHYWDPEIAETYTAADQIKGPGIPERLADLGALRIKDMDDAGIDFQIISHGAPSTQRLDAESAIRLCRPGLRTYRFSRIRRQRS